MKNLTLSLDDETYRQARIAAAERGTSVSALVRDYLQAFTRTAGGAPDPAAALFAALDQAGTFSAADRLSRDVAHARSSA
jgi:plasmid stability protein